MHEGKGWLKGPAGSGQGAGRGGSGVGSIDGVFEGLLGCSVKPQLTVSDGQAGAAV